METLVVLGHFAKWSQQLMGEAGVGEVQVSRSRASSPDLGAAVARAAWEAAAEESRAATGLGLSGAGGSETSCPGAFILGC